jgi:tRNA(fMet)-specific endonuclease VapC
VLVAAERGLLTLEELTDDRDDAAIAAITIAELLVGVELGGGRRRRARSRFLAAVVDAMEVEPYDADVARAHARLLVATRGSGRPRGSHDLIVAATAATTGRIVVSLDRRAFEDLPGVEVRAPA